MEEAERLLSIYSEYCPGVESAVEATRAMSPQDMERDVMIPKGNFMHVDMVFDQMFDRRPSKGLLDGYSFLHKLLLHLMFLVGHKNLRDSEK